MLSKRDIQQIREVVREEVTVQVEPIKQDIVVVKKNLKGLKMKSSRIQNTLDVAIRMFDRNHVGHEKRVKKIEDHLGFAPAS